MTKPRIAFVLAFLALALASYAQTAPDKKKAAAAPKQREDTQLLRYEISVSNPGTRSEGFSGKVFIAEPRRRTPSRSSRRTACGT